jgi:hypothetical protein
MTNNSEIKITYRHVPADILNDMTTLETKNVKVTLHHDRLEHFNASGGPADIVIYINNHLTELTVGGLLVNAVYDGIKFCIKSAWKKLVAHYSSRKSKYYDDGTSITLSFEIKPDKTVEYHLEGKVDSAAIDELTEELFRHLKNVSLIETQISNPDFQDDPEDKPKIRMRFNKKTGIWEPVNFAEWRKELKDYLKRAEDEFDG